MTRQHCLSWIAEREDVCPMPAKSACMACPFHDDNFWRYLKTESPDEFAEAVEFDHAIRGGGNVGRALDGEAFVHRSRQPLDLVDLRTPEERGQGSLFADEDGGFGESCDGGVAESARRRIRGPSRARQERRQGEAARSARGAGDPAGRTARTLPSGGSRRRRPS